MSHFEKAAGQCHLFNALPSPEMPSLAPKGTSCSVLKLEIQWPRVDKLGLWPCLAINIVNVALGFESGKIFTEKYLMGIDYKGCAFCGGEVMDEFTGICVSKRCCDVLGPGRINWSVILS